MSKQRQSQLAANFLGAGFYILGALWLGFSFAGWILVSRPETGKHSHLIGWAILITTTAIMLATMNHWVKYLRVFFGGAILVGILAIGSGHVPNGMLFPRPVAVALTALLVGCSLISQTLAKRPLTFVDRVTLVAFMAAFVGGVVRGTPTSNLVGLGVGFGCLLIAWAHDRWSTPSREPKDDIRNY
jgi:hypothetical protein